MEPEEENTQRFPDASNEQDANLNNEESQDAMAGEFSANDATANEPLTTQGDNEELEENMGGTTNLSLEQLKKEGDPAGNDDTVA